MATPGLLRILRLFYQTGLRYLPVIDPELQGAVEESEKDTGPDQKQAAGPSAGYNVGLLRGFISRENLDRELTDRDRAHQDKPLSESLFLGTTLPADLVDSLNNFSGEIPVLDIRGEYVAGWSSADALRAIALYQERLRENSGDGANAEHIQPVHSEQEEGEARSGADWLSRLILSEIQYPLFVADIQGQTLFFNETFERKVLGQAVMKNSLRLAEEYFLELTRNLLARSYTDASYSGAGEPEVLSTRLGGLGLNVELKPLQTEGGILGYLYVFRNPAQTALYEEIADMLEGNMGMEDIIDEVEANIIQTMLDRHGQNVSHTAKALKMRRTTLQNKLKRLQLEDKIKREHAGPIRRIRRTREELERDEIESLLAQARTESGQTDPGDARTPARTPLATKREVMDDIVLRGAERLISNKEFNRQKSKPEPAEKKVSKKTGQKTQAKETVKTARKTPVKTAPGVEKKTTKKAPKQTRKQTKKKTAKKVVTKTVRRSTKKVVKKVAKKAVKKTGSSGKKTASSRKTKKSGK